MSMIFQKTAPLMLAFIFASPIYLAADFDQGLTAYERGDYKTALQEWLPLAKKGDADAQYRLGVMYQFGNGLPRDDKEAVNWYLKAAEQGNAEAQNNLGLMYKFGFGVPQDYKEALKWYRKAAEQGNAEAQNNLGFMYELGFGIPQDYKEALNWYLKAAEQGVASALNNLGGMYYNGDGVPQDYVVAYALFNLSASVDASSTNDAQQNRSKVTKRMTPKQMEAGQALSSKMYNSKHPIKVLDEYLGKKRD